MLARSSRSSCKTTTGQTAVQKAPTTFFESQPNSCWIREASRATLGRWGVAKQAAQQVLWQQGAHTSWQKVDCETNLGASEQVQDEIGPSLQWDHSWDGTKQCAANIAGTRAGCCHPQHDTACLHSCSKQDWEQSISKMPMAICSYITWCYFLIVTIASIDDDSYNSYHS